ncbi:MAG: carboxypeptidase regulatory-like domain-containing protein [Deltaproteobacteria bacterium]|nr:carboxypeptidase regulatory-like domain-containing protein [Deltaproteobacteria bacterium]MCW5805403.1 carboxypeptidase regulatory-like domain-containing protein [Deltaproteobacteria bacterium]
MTDLLPCPACRRHVVIGAGGAPCPFCGVAQPGRAPHAPFAGAFVRIAVFGAAALGAPACWTNNPPVPRAHESAPAEGDGAIEGVLTSSSTGAPVAHHRVSLQATGQEVRHAVTDDEGRYRFAKLPPGDYVLTFAPPHHRTANMTTVQVKQGETQRVSWAVLDATSTP